MNSSEVLLIQGSLTFAYFGEMMGTFASEQSVPAVVVDGLTRDSSKTRDLTVAIFSKGFSPIDIKGRGTVVETDRPIALDGGRVNCAPGDFVFGDSDAVIVVPHEIEGDLIPILEKTIANERAIATALKSGLSAKELRGRFSSF
jgi:regulator of RNase E activity RraA